MGRGLFQYVFLFYFLEGKLPDGHVHLGWVSKGVDVMFTSYTHVIYCKHTCNLSLFFSGYFIGCSRIPGTILYTCIKAVRVVYKAVYKNSTRDLSCCLMISYLLFWYFDKMCGLKACLDIWLVCFSVSSYDFALF